MYEYELKGFLLRIYPLYYPDKNSKTLTKFFQSEKTVQNPQKIFHYPSISYSLFFGFSQPLGHVAIYVCIIRRKARHKA